MNSRRLKGKRALPGRWLGAAMLLAGLLMFGTAAPADATTDRSGLNDAIANYRAEGAAAALPKFERLLALYRDSGDRVAEGTAARYIGECYWRLGRLAESREHLDRAVGLARETGDHPGEGRALNVLGLLEWDLGNFEQALASFEQAQAVALELDDHRLAASTLNNRGLVRDELGDYEASLRDYERALALFDEAGDRRGQGDALGNMGGVHLLLGRYPTALDHYRRALVISEELESKPSMTIDHGNIALCLLGMGRNDEALAHFGQALRLARESGMSQEEAYWRRGMANVLVSQGRYDEGLTEYRAALAIYERSGARSLALDARHDMGMLMMTLGDPVSAETWFQEAITQARQIGQQRSLTANLIALGDLQFTLGRPEAARALYLQAGQRAGAAGEQSYRARSLLRLARVEREQRRFEAAAANAAAALGLAQDSGSRPIAAEAFFGLAEAVRGEAKVDQALAAYARAEEAAGPDGDPDLAWQIHYGRGRAQEQAHDLEAAVASLQVAVGIIESVRERLREERFRAGWVENKYQVYVDLVRLQLQLGNTHDAFSTAERLRARSFFAQLESKPAPSPVSGSQAMEEAALRERVRQLQRTLATEQDRAAPERRELAIETFSRELVQAERDYQAFLDNRGGPSGWSRGVRVPALEEIQQGLGPTEALLEYVVGVEQLMIFLVRRDRLDAFHLDVPLEGLSARINLLRELILRTEAETWKKPATALSGLLIEPVRQELLQDIRHVYLVPHGILNYLPFALLPLDEEAGQLMVEAFTLSYLPAAALLATAASIPESRRSLLAMAPATSRLQFAPREARSVAALFEPHADLLLGASATESAVKALAGDFRVLHFATHGVFNRRNPLLSGLELEADPLNDGLLEVHEILDLSLRAELVTLSACQTGLGSGWFSDVPAGDDFVGLTRAFLLAGSGSVLASLWEVDDRSTVDLMQGFYYRLAAGAPAAGQAAALARAQRAMRQSPDFHHPFYWAPFVLVGRHGSAPAPTLSRRG